LTRADQVAALLIDIEAQLRQLNLWQSTPPPSQALASSQPFAVDTMGFGEWLQFIFLPRMYDLLAAQGPLPTECAIAPMASEYFCNLGLPSQALECSLLTMDQLLTESA
jgi:uncharacterized protein YqcC (DUF446 family)